VIVSVNVVEGTRKRVQAYEGVVIAKRNRGLNSSFIVRKISSGEGVERTFQLYSPLIAGSKSSAAATCAAPSCTTCASRSGKSARIKEKLREAEEEIGLPPHLVEVIGSLPIYTTGTQFIVTPVVALVQPGHTLTPNPDEVALAFEVPLDFLMNPAHHRRHALEWANTRREWFSMPYVDQGQERFIWGATAGMLRNFYRFLSA
jgi:ribosomal protein L19